MEIIETAIFTREITRIVSDEEYREFQQSLAATPDAGDVIPGGGGLRKIRWKEQGRGKRGGMRIIYFWRLPDSLLMIYAYRKSETKDLSREQIRQLRNVVEEWVT